MEPRRAAARSCKIGYIKTEFEARSTDDGRAAAERAAAAAMRGEGRGDGRGRGAVCRRKNSGGAPKSG